MSSSSSPHVLVFPYPAQGHLIPLLDLADQMIARGLILTILVTPGNLPLLAHFLEKNPTATTLVLPFPASSDVPAGVENTKDVPPGSSTRIIMRALVDLQTPLRDWFKSQPSPPIAIISDFFLGWTQHLADELGIPRIVFYSSGSFVISMLNWLWDNLHQPQSPDFIVSMPSLPGSPSFVYRQLLSVFRAYIENPKESGYLKDGLVANNSSWGAVFNTFSALEKKYIQNMWDHTRHEKIWAVGPLLPDKADHSDKARGGKSSVPADEVEKWLDACDIGSVVYVCFGTQASLKNEQMQAIATALDTSQVRFVWVTKVVDPSVQGHFGSVPAGFVEGTAGRGLVITGWAPQVRILKHPSVGAFLTHCGWNSALEGLISGVCLLAWPLQADQFVNARLLVEDVGVAIRVCEGADTVPDPDHLARAMAESVSGSPHRRARINALKEAALAALAPGGTSQNDLEDLVTQLQGLGLTAKA